MKSLRDRRRMGRRCIRGVRRGLERLLCWIDWWLICLVDDWDEAFDDLKFYGLILVWKGYEGRMVGCNYMLGFVGVY
jgi:hypothetical protein